MAPVAAAATARTGSQAPAVPAASSLPYLFAGVAPTLTLGGPTSRSRRLGGPSTRPNAARSSPWGSPRLGRRPVPGRSATATAASCAHLARRGRPGLHPRGVAPSIEADRLPFWAASRRHAYPTTLARITALLSGSGRTGPSARGGLAARVRVGPLIPAGCSRLLLARSSSSPPAGRHRVFPRGGWFRSRERGDRAGHTGGASALWSSLRRSCSPSTSPGTGQGTVASPGGASPCCAARSSCATAPATHPRLDIASDGFGVADLAGIIVRSSGRYVRSAVPANVLGYSALDSGLASCLPRDDVVARRCRPFSVDANGSRSPARRLRACFVRGPTICSSGAATLLAGRTGSARWRAVGFRRDAGVAVSTARCG